MAGQPSGGNGCTRCLSSLAIRVPVADISAGLR